MARQLHVLLQRARAGDAEAARRATSLPEADAEALEELAHSAQAQVRAGVAEHPHAADETLLRLAYDPDEQVAVAVARREDVSSDLLHSLALRTAAEHAVLRGRERARAYALAAALASNPSVEEQDLDRLLQGPGAGQLARFLAREAEREDVLERLARHAKPTIRANLLANPALPNGLAVRLAEDRHPRVRSAAEARLAREPEQAGEAGVDHVARKRARGDEAAAHWEAQLVRRAGGTGELEALVRFFADVVVDGTCVLDLGCATGPFAAAAAARNPGGRTVGLDVSPGMLDRARARTGTGPLVWVRADLDRGIPVPDACADVVFLRGVLCGVQDPTALLSEVMRVLREDGRLAALVPCLASEGTDTDLVAQAGAAQGFQWAPFDATATLVATSGLMIESLSSAAEGIWHPGAASANEEAMCPAWARVAELARAAGADPGNAAFGLVRAVGRKRSL